MNNLIRIPFPQFEDGIKKVRFYKGIKPWLDKAGYVYGVDYKFEWLFDTGKYVPDYLWLPEELAMIFKLRYNCVESS